MKWIDIQFPQTTKGSPNVTVNSSTYLFNYPCSSNSDCEPYTLILDKGYYLFELWGAAGGTDGAFSKQVAYGSYVSGYIQLNHRQSFLLYIGGKGTDGIVNVQSCVGGYNGGGDGGYSAGSGGGATDIRLSSSYESRIIVAAGAGGGERTANGHGGTIEGIQGTCLPEYDDVNSTQGTQTEGGKGGENTNQGKGGDGDFGIGGNGNIGREGGAGGGGGYYGGGATPYRCSGSGGSSFISGHSGCKAITSETDRTPKQNSIHYSGLYFRNTIMLAGNEPMPKRDLLPFKDNNKVASENSNGAFRLSIIDIHLKCTEKMISYRFYVSSLFVNIIYF